MNEPVESQPAGRTVWSSLRVYLERPALVMLALGFAAGLPYFLIFDTLSAWLRAESLPLEVIGFFSLVTLVTSFKFLWAPIVDRTQVPLLTAWLGHRRSWMLVCQAVIIVGLALLATSDPARALGPIAVFAVLVGFASATQDVALDAWRIEAAESSKQGAMAAAYAWGYRGAMIIAGAVPLLLAESYGWRFSYAVMAALMAVGVIGVLAAPREARHVVGEVQTGGITPAPVLEALEWALRLTIVLAAALVMGSGLAGNAGVLARVLGWLGAVGARDFIVSAWMSPRAPFFHLTAILVGMTAIGLVALPLPGARTRPGVYLSSALVDPLRDFFSRYRSAGGLILALICLYRVPDFLLNIMNPFYLDLGYSLVEIAEVRKIFGVAMTLFGVFAGGVAVARYGVLRAMVIGAAAGPLSNLLFVWLATEEHNLLVLFAAIGLDNVAGGFAGTCLIAYMSSLTSAGFTATQYALFSSLYAIPGRLLASQSGRIVESMARTADAGGMLAGIKAFFVNHAPTNFATAVERSGVSPGALGTGYVVFFVYTAAIGVFALALSWLVLRRQEAAERSAD